ncbi:TRAP transporter small permease subunit [Paracoccus sp. P2]|uniref:TRAP transporter small permease subunit n=1 Tax=Paracoccus sp. P2 TaxID=3248840 RepID=UPI00391F0B32
MSLHTVHSGLSRAARIACIAGGLGIIFLSIMITVDILLRKLFGTTLGGAHEFSGFIFAVATAFAYPYVLLDRANIRIDVAYNLVGVRIRAILDFLAMLALLIFVFLLARSIYDLAAASWTSGRMSIGIVRVPLWLPQGLWVFGYLLFTATAAFLTLYAAIGLFRRDWQLVNRVAGIPSVNEMIQEETHIGGGDTGSDVTSAKHPGDR